MGDPEDNREDACDRRPWGESGDPIVVRGLGLNDKPDAEGAASHSRQEGIPQDCDEMVQDFN